MVPLGLFNRPIVSKLFAVDDSRDGACGRLETRRGAHYNEHGFRSLRHADGPTGPEAGLRDGNRLVKFPKWEYCRR